MKGDGRGGARVRILVASVAWSPALGFVDAVFFRRMNQALDAGDRDLIYVNGLGACVATAFLVSFAWLAVETSLEMRRKR